MSGGGLLQVEGTMEGMGMESSSQHVPGRWRNRKCDWNRVGEEESSEVGLLQRGTNYNMLC